MRKTILLLAAILTLSSCVGIESRLTLRADGSGSLDLTYRIAQLIQDLGRSAAERPPIPVPVSRDDFERGLQGVTGVELTSFSRTENEKDIIVRARLSFTSVDSLAKIAAFRDTAPSVSASGNRHTLTQLIVKADPQEVSADTLQMMDAFFEDYAITLIVEAPSPIQSFSLGALSSDKKTFTYSAPVKDLVTTKRDVVLSLTW